jgi:uncharacterized protein (DUF2267 family)
LTAPARALWLAGDDRHDSNLRRAVSHELEQFMTTVQQKARISRPDAERATRATLETLAERLSKGEARDLAAELPPEIAPWLATDGDAEGFDIDEFIRRVADREGADLDAAQRHARAVFEALGRTVSRGEIDDMVAELPQEYEPLIFEAKGRFVRVQPAEVLLRRIADRAGVHEPEARRAADAVLETLAERIAGGEVEDLIRRLPVELHPPLRKGDAESHGAARKMSLEEFVRRVAEREGIAPADAFEHTRAVFATLREAVGEEEFRDISAQLPVEYAAVEAHP